MPWITTDIHRERDKWLSTHCKPKPCKPYRELPVSQFSQGKTCFHYRDFPVKPCTSLLGIVVQLLYKSHLRTSMLAISEHFSDLLTNFHVIK